MARKTSRKRSKSRIKKEACRVHAVYDGDTITVERVEHSWLGLREHVHLVKVRLAYIDTPELQYQEPGAITAKECLEKLIVKKRVVLEYEELPSGKPRMGLYSRMLAVVHLERIVFPNININEFLLRKGLARLYEDPDDITPHHWRRFTRAERYAQRKRLGIWRHSSMQYARSPLRSWLLIATGIIIGILIGLALM